MIKHQLVKNTSFSFGFSKRGFSSVAMKNTFKDIYEKNKASFHRMYLNYPELRKNK